MTTVNQLIAAFRADMFDPELPGTGSDKSSESLWTDSEIKRYISYAQNDFCRATMCLSDPHMFKPKITAGDREVIADERIIKPRDAFLLSTGRALEIMTVREMDEAAIHCDYGFQISTNWRGDGVSGTPRILVTDDRQGYYTLYPTPVVDDTLKLGVYRLPETPVYDGGDLEVPEEYRFRLLPGMKVHAFSKEDEEVHDEKMVAKYDQIWTRYLNQVTSHFKQKRRGSHRVRYGGL
jgi:hypothetical protein